MTLTFAAHDIGRQERWIGRDIWDIYIYIYIYLFYVSLSQGTNSLKLWVWHAQPRPQPRLHADAASVWESWKNWTSPEEPHVVRRASIPQELAHRLDGPNIPLAHFKHWWERHKLTLVHTHIYIYIYIYIYIMVLNFSVFGGVPACMKQGAKWHWPSQLMILAARSGGSGGTYGIYIYIYIYIYFT